MRRRAFLAAALAAVATPAWADVWGVRPAPRPPLRRGDEAALVAAARLGGAVAWAVRDALSGALIAGEGIDRPLPPASTLKAITSLFSLDRLGPAHRFATRVLLDGERLILAGGGDPTLDTDGLAVLARQVAPALRGQRLGAFSVWGGALPQRSELVAGQAAHLAYNPAISGIILNFNRVHLDWRAGQNGLRLALEARADHASPTVRSIRIQPADRRAPRFDWRADASGERWTVARSALGRQGSRWLPVRQPELYAGDVFRTLMKAEGVDLPPATILPTSPAGREIARHDSPPLEAILRDMMDYSTNLTAEVVGLAASGASGTTASAAVMERWLRQKLPLDQRDAPLRLGDHSGLGADSRVTPGALSAIVAGELTALNALMKPHPTRDAGGRALTLPLTVRAKTGTLNFVSNLAGSAVRTDRPGAALTFAILCADEERRAASEGEELPPGSAAWLQRARHLQAQLVEGWAAKWG